MKNVKKFVCELGFSTAKWMIEDKKGRVPSVYLQRGNMPPLIGNDALYSQGGVSYLRTTDSLLRCYPWFVEKCLDEAGVAENDQVKVAVGLPYQFWEEQKEINGGALDQLSQTLLSTRVKEVEIYPQGLGGVTDFIKSTKNLPSDLILGIDVGQHTVIHTLFDPVVRKVISSRTMWGRGVSEMIEHYLKPLVLEHTSGKAITPTELALIAEKGSMTIGFGEVDVTPEVGQAANAYTSNLLTEIIEDVSPSIPPGHTLKTVLFFGGGASHLKDVKSGKKVDIIILPEPEFANARGFMKILEG